MAEFETVVVETDLLILGGGMAACGAAVEAAHWAKQNGLKVTLVDKAAVDRSGAVAMGLSAINQYVGLKDGANSIKDYVDYVRNDLMGITREDLVANIARHVDSTVHLFEKWGLPIWKDEKGAYVHEGRWQLMINGESYKVVVAEAAKNALLQTGVGEIFERVFIVGPLMDGERCAGAVGFSVRENKFYVFKSKATLVAMGGAVHVFKPRSSGEGMGRAWYPPWNSGSSAYFTLKAGAEMTCQEVRFIPVRFKDAYGPVGAWFLLFKSRATNALGGNYMIERKPELEKWGPYGRVKPVPANLRNYLGMLDVMEGKGPISMRTEEAIQAIAETYKDDPKAYKKKMKELESRSLGRLPRHDHLAGPALGRHQRAARRAEFRDRRRRAVLHRLALRRFGRLGQRSRRSADRRDQERVLLGLRATCRRCRGCSAPATRRALPATSSLRARTPKGASPPRPPSSSSWRTTRCRDLDPAAIEALKAEILKPLDTFEQFQKTTTDPEINPNYIKPRMFMFRLQKIMDEYAGGITAQFTTNEALLKKAPGTAGLPEGGFRETGRRRISTS